jgi:hypothetical protein
MIFKDTWKLVLSGEKTQARRLVQPGDSAEYNDPDNRDNITQVVRTADSGVPKVIFEVGKSYPIQSGPGKKTMSSIIITAIRRELLQDISENDALKEFPGASPDETMTDSQWAVKAFSQMWDTWHPEEGARWQDNPEVWVIEFKLPFG